MNITKNLYQEILYRCPSALPESGGLLGGSRGCVNEVYYEPGLQSEQRGCYIPDVERLNQCLKNWHRKNITFYGIFHTHLPNWKTLSEGDRTYIKTIMKAMPETVGVLYFPLVFPKERIVSFRAERSGAKICIVPDVLNIICEGEEPNETV